MKKLLTIFAVVAASGSVNAAEVYSMDGVSVDISGDVEMQYLKTQSSAQQSELQVAGGSFGFDVAYELTEDFSVATTLGFDVDNDTDDVTRGDVSISFIIAQSHTISLGAQSMIIDDAGIGDDWEFGFTSYIESLESEGDQVFKYKYDGGEMLYAGVAYSEYKNETGIDSDDYELDGNIGARIDDYELTLFAEVGEHSDLDENTLILEGRYTRGDLKFAASVSRSSSENAGAADTDVDMFGLTAMYDEGGRWNYAAGWANIDNSDNSESINDFYVNATFVFSDNLESYAEVGFTDEDNADTGYVVGIKGTF